MNFHLRPYNQYILNIVTNIYLGLDFFVKKQLNENSTISHQQTGVKVTDEYKNIKLKL